MGAPRSSSGLQINSQIERKVQFTGLTGKITVPDCSVTVQNLGVIGMAAGWPVSGCRCNGRESRGCQQCRTGSGKTASPVDLRPGFFVRFGHVLFLWHEITSETKTGLEWALCELEVNRSARMMLTIKTANPICSLGCREQNPLLGINASSGRK
jgi:hypothetical protein